MLPVLVIKAPEQDTNTEPANDPPVLLTVPEELLPVTHSLALTKKIIAAISSPPPADYPPQIIPKAYHLLVSPPAEQIQVTLLLQPMALHQPIIDTPITQPPATTQSIQLLIWEMEF